MAKKRRTRKARGPARDHYQEITDRMVAALEKAAESGEPLAPWQKPWEVSPYGSAPHNPASGTVYRGINTWITLMAMWDRGYDVPMFLTFKQANEIAAKALRAKGIKVEHKAVGRKARDPKKQKKVWVYAEGENAGKSCGGIKAGQNKENGCGGITVVFWKRGTRVEEDDDGNERRHSWGMLRTFTVFNVAQCDDHVREFLCPPVADAPEFTPLEQCERICEGYEVETRHGGDRAYYMPSEDRIQLPQRESFATPEGYYTTRFHEMGHSTGHVSRLARDSMKPGKHREIHSYAEEELVAEFAACFLAGEAGIVRTVEGNSAAYLRHWASKLREDKRLVVYAAQRAQKAADLILGREFAQTSDTDSEAPQGAVECEAA
jgi:antirestriction protein ArdC